MIYTSFDRRGPAPRRGIILLVVITMLTMFAVVGLGFVYYAEGEAAASQIARQQWDKTLPDADPELLLSYFLSQLIYDVSGAPTLPNGNPAPNYNPYSVLRGHSLARTMYGYNPIASNSSAYSGIGRLHYTQPAPVLTNTVPADDFYFANYQYYPNDGFVRDPEFYGFRTSPQAAVVAGNYRAGNAPYTYPDLNNMYLARVDADGTVRMPSFYRPWVVPYLQGGNPTTPPVPPVPPLTTQNYRYAQLIPDRAFYNSGFVTPDSDPPPGKGMVGPDVRNLDFSPGCIINGVLCNNDSYWLDAGWPVMIAPNGKKYKAMFAPLVVDLDNRINLWVSGNNRGAGGIHASNRGYGPSEINLATATNPIVMTNDLPWLFANRVVTTPPFPGTWPARDGPYYARIDFDAINGGPLQLPGSYGAAPTNYFTTPNYTAWYSGYPAELTGVGLGYNLFTDTRSVVRASNMEAILRHKGVGGPAVTSALFKNMPYTFTNAKNPNADRARGMLTTLSWGLDRITASPYIQYNTATNQNYLYDPTVKAYPQLQIALSSPSWAAAAAGSEFTSHFHSTLVRQLRINLNRLSNSAYDYPTPDPTTGFILPANMGQFAIAQSARADNVNRVGLAFDIYNVLVQVTGAMDPNNPANAGMKVTLPKQYQAAQWLAQLAVNIVDYVDNDDISTPFNWDAVNNDWVFGTEPPRLVINEAYTQLDNNAADFAGMAGDATPWTATSTYNLNAWVELHNPFKTTPAGETYPFDGGVARPFVVPPAASGVAAFAAYEIILSQPDANLRAVGNNRGNSAAASKLQTVRTWGPGTAVQVNPANGAFSDPKQANNGFFVLGPSTTFLAATPIGMTGVSTPATNPNLPVTFASPQMSYGIPLAQTATTATALVNNGTTILLRRLACPYLPSNTKTTIPNPNNALTTIPNPNYNPYVTVDYVQNVKTWDNRVAKPTVVAAALPGPVTANAAMGRNQPYYASTLVAQTPNPALANQPQNTFFSHNTPLTTPFTWLTHLDRPVVNSIELLHVSGYRPHELTQQFIVNGVPFQHYAPWLRPSAMIYRALELLGVPSYLNGTSMGGRVPGKININTMNEKEIFLALCDPQNVSSFIAADVNNLYTNLILSRTPAAVPGPTDTPFRSFTAGWIKPNTPPLPSQYPQGAGLRDTFLRNVTVAGVTQRLFQLPQTATRTHPYQQWELLQKIYNNTTTTSNVFAVWLTVGFFEVDDSVTPPKLLTEIGRDQGRQIRHRMFAIVDRSQLTLFSTTATAFTVNPVAGAPTTVPVTAITGQLPNGTIWTIQPGMLLEVGVPGNSEVVVVKSVGANSFTAVFSGNFPMGAPGNWPATSVVCRGNPGPKNRYNPRHDPLVVPHFTIIQ